MSVLEDKVKKFVHDSYTKDGVTSSTVEHQLETAVLVKELNPDVSDAVIIAALSHDIERAYRESDMFEILKTDKLGFKSPEFLKRHQERGAEIVAKFLKEAGEGGLFIDEVKDLISHHEVGGTKGSDLLKDADSLSFFSSRALHFVETKINISSADKVRFKLDWMFDRISSEKVKELALPQYTVAIKALEGVK